MAQFRNQTDIYGVFRFKNIHQGPKLNVDGWISFTQLSHIFGIETKYFE